LQFENQSVSVEVDEEAEIVDGEKTVTKGGSVPDAPADVAGSGEITKAKGGFLKTGDVVRAEQQEAFGDVEDLLQATPKKNGKAKKTKTDKGKKNLLDLVKDAEDLDLDAIVKNDDPDMVDLDAIIGNNGTA